MQISCKPTLQRMPDGSLVRVKVFLDDVDVTQDATLADDQEGFVVCLKRTPNGSILTDMSRRRPMPATEKRTGVVRIELTSADKEVIERDKRRLEKGEFLEAAAQSQKQLANEDVNLRVDF